jgi:predicted amidohydrolase YtcJ
MDDKIGSLEKGKFADFIIVNKNPFTIPTSKLSTIKCLQTFINGNLTK